MVMAHWNWLGAQVTSAAGGRKEVRKGSRAGRGQPAFSPKTTHGAERCEDAPGITRGWCAQWRRWSRAIKWPQKTPSYGGIRQRPPEPSTGQQAQPKPTSKDLRISFPLGNSGDGDRGLAETREPKTPRHRPEPLRLAHADTLSPPLTTVLLVLAVPAVVLPVAAEDAGDAAVGVGALELAGQAHVDVWGRGGTVRG